MEEVKNESEKKEEQTPAQTDLTEKKNDSQPNAGETTPPTNEGGEGHGDDYIPPTKEEYEKIRKKATDFDGLLEKQRLQRLAGKEEEKKEEKKEEATVIDANAIKEIVAQQVQSALSGINKTKSDESLKDVYREFIQDNPWADNDEVIADISKNFQRGDVVEKDQLRAKLNVAAQSSFPGEYNKALEDKIKAKLLAEQSTIDAGDAGGGGSAVNKGDETKKAPTPEQIAFAKKCGNDPSKVYGTN